MSLFIFTLTLRQLLGRKSTLIPVALALLPVLIAVVFRLSNPNDDPQHWAANVLYVGLVVTAVLPLTALLIGTSVLGDELEDGTAIYLLTKPLPRWQILLPKLAAATVVTLAISLASTVISGMIALQGESMALVKGFAVAMVFGSIAYTSLFVMLSLWTNRALIAGLVFVFIWEATVTEIFTGVRYISVRHYTLGIARWVADTPASTFDAQVSGRLALALLVTVTAIAILYANRLLCQIEVRESS